MLFSQVKNSPSEEQGKRIRSVKAIYGGHSYTNSMVIAGQLASE